MSVMSTTLMSTRERTMIEATSADRGSTKPKVTQIQGSTTPHAASGKGKTRERLERGAAARRAVFAVSLAGFVGFFGLIATAGKPAPALSSEQPAPASELPRANHVVAEIPVSGLNGDTNQTIIRIVAPEPRAPAPHVRTRAS